MTKENKKIAIVAAIVAAVVLLLAILYVRSRESRPKVNTTDPKNTAGAGTGATPSKFTDQVDEGRVLKRGDAGNSVVELQKALNIKASNKLVPDGYFGPATETELKKQTGKIAASIFEVKYLSNATSGNVYTNYGGITGTGIYTSPADTTGVYGGGAWGGSGGKW